MGQNTKDACLEMSNVISYWILSSLMESMQKQLAEGKNFLIECSSDNTDTLL